MKTSVLFPKLHHGIYFSEQSGTSDSYKATYLLLVVTLVAIGLQVYINCIYLLLKRVDLSEMCTHWVDMLAELL